MCAADPRRLEPESVLVLTRAGRDAELTREILEDAGLHVRVVPDVRALCAALREGAGLAVIAEELLDPDAVRALTGFLSEQPPWSDLPFVVLGVAVAEKPQDLPDAARALGNVAFLERPVRVRTLVAAAHAALRSRRRQYEARRAIAARDQFLAMLGHELRNPLAAMRLAIDLMGRSKPAAAARHLATIDRQTRTLTRMVDDLLDVARVTTGKVVLRPENVDLAEIVRGCVQQHRPAAHAHDLDLDLQITGEPLRVYGDRVRLEQVVANLVGNAIKYTPSLGKVRVTLQRDGRSALLRVVDTGVGIAPEMLDRVFEVFAQADRSLARSQGGMGLGLPVVHSLVQLHGGKVEARSEGPGRGSEFRVSLPLAPDAPAARESQPGPAPQVAPRRVVIVEDNDEIRASEMHLLTLAGHQVETARDGPEGTEAILRVRPDVAFVDLGLPGYDGLEVARRVRGAVGSAVTLVAVSGYGREEDRRAALQAGFDLHLVKPVGLAELEAAMRITR